MNEIALSHYSTNPNLENTNDMRPKCTYIFDVIAFDQSSKDI